MRVRTEEKRCEGEKEERYNVEDRGGEAQGRGGEAQGRGGEAKGRGGGEVQGQGRGSRGVRVRIMEERRKWEGRKIR